MIDTDETLLDRLRNTADQTAWRECYDAYWAVIVRYARKLGLDEASAHDVLQETMIALTRALPRFAYDRRRGLFRNFLLTIVHRKTVGRIRRRTGADPVAIASALADAEPPRPASVAAALWQESILEEALERLRADPLLGENTFEIFEAYALAGRPAAAVARTFGIKENAVYQIKNRLLRRLRAEVKWLQANSGGESLHP